MNPRTPGVTRRKFFSLAGMISALVAAYGLFAGVILKFLYPRAKSSERSPMFVTFADQIDTGKSHAFYTPTGEQVILTNTGQSQPGQNHNFIAFSSRCPHLGCKVHFDGGKQQFVCPCHQGAFNMQGVAVAGPPAAAKQRLSAYEVVADGNSVYVKVEVS